MTNEAQVPISGQALSSHATEKHSWRKVVVEIALALLLAWACAMLVEWIKSALAAPPCEAAIHRLVIEPTPHPRCLTFPADFPA